MKGLLVLVLVSMALATENNQLVASIKDKIGTTVYGQQLTDLVELHLSGGNALDQVLRIVGDMVKKLESDQKADDTEQSQRQAQAQASIALLEKNLENLNNESQDNNRAIGDLSEAVAHLSQSSVTLQKQITLLADREQSIHDTRAVDSDGFAKRTEQNNKLLHAIGELKVRVYNSVNNENGVWLQKAEKKSFVSKLKKEIGERNPLALLVELTTHFDHETAGKIIKKLEQLEETIKQQIVEDQAQEERSASLYTQIDQEVTNVRENLSQEFDEVVSETRSLQNDFAIAQRHQVEVTADLEKTEELLIQTRIQNESQEGSFVARTQQRKAEIQTLKEAYDLIYAQVYKSK